MMKMTAMKNFEAWSGWRLELYGQVGWLLVMQFMSGLWSQPWVSYRMNRILLCKYFLHSSN